MGQILGVRQLTVYAQPSDAAKLFAKLSILVVEDSPHMRKLLCEMLRALEVGTILDAGDGSEGWQKFQTHHPDIVLTDASMEPMDGYALLENIRAHDNPHLATTPVIMVTGHCEVKAVERARDLGVTEYLAKPITPVGLYSRLMEAAAHPRPFVRAEGFFGPDRRRREKQALDGEDRRRGAAPVTYLDI